MASTAGVRQNQSATLSRYCNAAKILRRWPTDLTPASLSASSRASLPSPAVATGARTAAEGVGWHRGARRAAGPRGLRRRGGWKRAARRGAAGPHIATHRG
eukprot:5912405-Prymnesium_polylepis.1